MCRQLGRVRENAIVRYTLSSFYSPYRSDKKKCDVSAGHHGELNSCALLPSFPLGEPYLPLFICII